MTPAGTRLEQRVRAVRAHLEQRTWITVGLWSGAAVAGVLALAWVLAGPEGWRQGSDVPLVLDAVILALLAGATQAVRWVSRRWFAEAPLTASIERAAGLRHGSVRGPLELGRALPPGVSAGLAGRAAEAAVRDLEGPVAELGGSLGGGLTTWTRRGSGLFAAMAVILVALTLVGPTRAGRAWSGLSMPFRLAVDPRLPDLLVDPGDVEVPRGSSVRVGIVAPGRDRARLAWRVAGDVGRTVDLQLEDGRAAWSFDSVGAPIEYRAATEDGAEAGPYRIVPVDPLFVSDVVVQVLYPPHTGIAPEEHRGAFPPLLLPLGTRLRIGGQASRPLSSARLTDSLGAVAARLTVDGAAFQGTWQPVRSGRFDWSFLDAESSAAEVAPSPLELLVLADSAPDVSVPVPGRDTVLPLSLRQPLVLEARDDYGLSRLELVAYRVTSVGEALEPVVQGIDLAGTRSALARPLLDVRSWGLLPGDRVHYFARATDNAPVGQTGSSREYVLRMPTASELRREAGERMDDVARALEEVAESAALKAEETRALERETAADPEASRSLTGRPEPASTGDFERREELRDALEGQRAMAEQVDSLRGELETVQRGMEEAGQADPALREDLAELQQLLSEVSSEAMRDRLAEMLEAVDDQGAREAGQSLQELSQEQEDFRERLEASLERFRRAAVEQDFRATRGEVAELAQQERALSDALRTEDQPELRARQQEEVAQRTEALQERLDRLQERLEQLEETPAAREVADARRRAQSAQERMDEAMRDAQSGRSQDAAEQAERAAEAMDDTAEQLAEAQDQMAAERGRAMLEALERAADDALALARRQSRLRRELETAGQERVAELRADEAALAQGLRNLAEGLHAETGGAMEGARELSAQMGRALEALQRTLRAMESRRTSAPGPSAEAERAVGELNQVALMAMASAERMGQQQGGQSGQDVSEQLEELAQQQGDVMNQTGQLTPMQLGQQAMQEQLRRLAQEQGEVARELEELSGQEGAGEESLGSLDQLAEEARAISEQLAQGRLEPDMMRRQERLFHRLLDAGRSLDDEREVSDEREAEAPGAFERAAVEALGAEDMGVRRYTVPDPARLRSLPPAVRRLVIQYFERINRGRDDPGGQGPER